MNIKTWFIAGWIRAIREGAAAPRVIPIGFCADALPAPLGQSPEEVLAFRRSPFHAAPSGEDRASSDTGTVSSSAVQTKPEDAPAPSVLPSLRKGSRSFSAFLQWFAVLFLPGGAVGVLWVRGRLRLTPDLFNRLNAEPTPEQFDKLLSYTRRLAKWAGLPMKEETAWAARAEKDPRFARFRQFLSLIEKHRARRGSLRLEEYREAAAIVASARRSCLSPLTGYRRWRFLFLKKL